MWIKESLDSKYLMVEKNGKQSKKLAEDKTNICFYRWQMHDLKNAQKNIDRQSELNYIYQIMKSWK